MEKEKLQKTAKILAIVGLFLTFLFGGIAATVSYIFDNNYLAQRNKYDAISIGMGEKQVEEILGEGSKESEIPSRARLEGDFDEIYMYNIPILTATSGSWAVISYKQGRVVSKCAYGGDNETFFLEKRPKGVLQDFWEWGRSWLYWLVQLIGSGFLSYLCFVFTHHKDFMIKEYKKTIVLFILLAEFGVVIYTGFWAFLFSSCLLFALPFSM